MKQGKVLKPGRMHNILHPCEYSLDCIKNVYFIEGFDYSSTNDIPELAPLSIIKYHTRVGIPSVRL